jgi:hypothetical protein
MASRIGMRNDLSRSNSEPDVTISTDCEEGEGGWTKELASSLGAPSSRCSPLPHPDGTLGRAQYLRDEAHGQRVTAPWPLRKGCVTRLHAHASPSLPPNLARVNCSHIRMHLLLIYSGP